MRTMLGNIGRNTAYTLLQTNEINYIRVGRKYKIPKKYIIEFLLKSDSAGRKKSDCVL
ncbi:helix-turn-helix domain-containing protein [Enterococcus gallinarum]|uniref:helix-turn-helix domain-containing protein n=2 Tax=Enterococcus TaxID=1350 RepID=UPI002433E23C|nr:helix-turn-helix domain-containing protein [Enterococcus gallinarum]